MIKKTHEGKTMIVDIDFLPNIILGMIFISFIIYMLIRPIKMFFTKELTREK